MKRNFQRRTSRFSDLGAPKRLVKKSGYINTRYVVLALEVSGDEHNNSELALYFPNFAFFPEVHECPFMQRVFYSDSSNSVTAEKS